MFDKVDWDQIDRRHLGKHRSHMRNQTGYMQIKEAAEYLGFTSATLRNSGNAGKVNEHRHPVNSYRLYKKSELDCLLRQAEQTQKKK
jgi:DNA (cytosine-5)-methyltransferase 1